jgi:hypothetical protein
MALGEVNASNDIGRSRTANDQGWTPIDHGVEHQPGLVVTVITGTEQLAPQPGPELLDGIVAQMNSLSRLCFAGDANRPSHLALPG